MALRLGVYGASGRQGQRYLDASNWPANVELFALARGVKPECDGVIVATPPATHEPISFRCMGMPMLCEKPLALDLKDASHIIARAALAPLLVAHTNLWREDFLELEPSPSANVVWCGEERADASCPALLDWGTHAWSMALALGTERVTTGYGDRRSNRVASKGKSFPSQDAWRYKPMREMLASFVTLIRGGQDWRASPAFALDVQRRCLTASDSTHQTAAPSPKRPG